MLAVFSASGCSSDAGSGTSGSGPEPLIQYQTDAAGAPATEADRWPVRFSQPVGVVTAMARCGGTAFLVDIRESSVSRVDLARGEVVGMIGTRKELNEPMAVAADCAAERLYVVNYRAVLVYRISDGNLLRTYPLPRQASPGERPAVTRIKLPIVTRDQRYLYASAFWAAEPGFSSSYPQDALFKGARLGLELSLEDGRMEATAEPIELGCRGFAEGCWLSSLGATDLGKKGPFVLGQGLSQRMAVYDPGTASRRLVDIRSPRFKNDGRPLNRDEGGRDRKAAAAWSATNSAVDAVLPFGEAIATIHFHGVPPKPGDGGLVQDAAFMNLHGIDGTPLVSDIALPGRPNGRDGDSLYVIDYGPGGRRAAVSALDIVRIVPTPTGFRSR
jgi:hypothetical protein